MWREWKGLWSMPSICQWKTKGDLCSEWTEIQVRFTMSWNILGLKFSHIFYVSVAQEELAGSVTDVHQERLAPIGVANAEDWSVFLVPQFVIYQSQNMGRVSLLQFIIRWVLDEVEEGLHVQEEDTIEILAKKVKWKIKYLKKTIWSFIQLHHETRPSKMEV